MRFTISSRICWLKRDRATRPADGAEFWRRRGLGFGVGVKGVEGETRCSTSIPVAGDAQVAREEAFIVAEPREARADFLLEHRAQL